MREKGEDHVEDAEMDVDDEEKVELEGTDDSDSDVPDDDEGDEDPVVTAGRSSVPFLDSFYGLSAADPRERAYAAQEMIRSCLIGPNANITDAAYAFKRLLNGLCSGRAAARQGNASALASFLKVAQAQEGKLNELQRELLREGEETLPVLAFVRQRLLSATDPGEVQGRRKGSEERDYKFGRLFGILGIARSGILCPTGSNRFSREEILQVTSAFVRDLSDLYGYKKWMREPSAHAVVTLINGFYDLCPKEQDAVTIIDDLVENTIVPSLLLKGDRTSDDSGIVSFSAEQIALALVIQSQSSLHSRPLPQPLNQPVLSMETLRHVSEALSDTSSVTQPRTHLVWDALCFYVSQPSEGKESAKVKIRAARTTCPVNEESVQSLIEGIMEHVVLERLLKVTPDTDESTVTGKATHERRSLALCLVRNFCGAEFMSSITGRTRLLLGHQVIEEVVMVPGVVKEVFIRTVCSGSSGHGRVHLLQPLGLQVLEAIISSVVDDVEMAWRELSTADLRLSLIRPLIGCDPRFDSKSKTPTIRRLLDIQSSDKSECRKLWKSYVDFLKRRVCAVSSEEIKGTDNDRISVYDAQGYVDLLFNFAKFLELNRNAEVDDDRREVENDIHYFLMALSFFNCKVVASEKSQKGKKSKKKKPEHPNQAIQSAAYIQSARSETQSSEIPFSLRAVGSARFFSLLADDIITETRNSADKGSVALSRLSGIIRGWEDLEAAGAVSYGPSSDEIKVADDEESESLGSIVSRLCKDADGGGAEGNEQINNARIKWKRSIAVLVATLYIHLLGCGSSDGLDEEDPSIDDEADADDIRVFVADATEILELFEKPRAGEDPLAALSELCVNILSSSIAEGNQVKGGSPKLLREVVKQVWVTGLSLSALLMKCPDPNTKFVDILLESIGAGDTDAMEDGFDDEEDEDSRSGTNSESSMPDSASIDDASSDNAADVTGENEVDNDEVELDPDRLQSFLEEDTDEDVDENQLEHHAGADQALAKLLKIKQEARKAGQLARERVDIAQRLRCTVLVELLLIGKPDGWGSLLTANKALGMFVPMLRCRKELERAVSRAAERPNEVGLGDKRALLDRLSSLLNTKVIKVKCSGRAWDSSINIEDFCTDISSRILVELRGNGSKDYKSTCSLALAAVVRAPADATTQVRVAKVYETVTSEWATKRTTRLDTNVLQDFVNHSPVLAQAVLPHAVASAASEARSSYLKSEALRLLSVLFSRKLNCAASELESMAKTSVDGALGPTLLAFRACLNDPSMRKAKRAREVIKSLEKVLTYLLTARSVTSEDREAAKQLDVALNEMMEQSDSQAVVGGCEKVLKQVHEVISGRSVQRQGSTSADKTYDEEDRSNEPSTSKKKKKKKTKKKKR